MAKSIRKLLFVLAVSMILYINVSNIDAASSFAQAGDYFATCDANGNNVGAHFIKATVNITGADNSDNYSSYGVDIGIFKKPDTGADWTKVYAEYIPKSGISSTQTVTISDFGDITKYEYSGIYVISYRVLYQSTDSPEITMQGSWKQVSGSYFKVLPAHIYPTLNTPTVSGLIYMGDDIAVSDTGTNINQAAYRVFYTTNALAPSINNGNDPGAGWHDSGISEAMNVDGTTGVSATVQGASLGNNNWTFVTYKVWAASSTNDSATQYSQAYAVSNDGISAINYVGFNQIMFIFNTRKSIIVSDPDTPVQPYNPNEPAQGYNPDPASLGYLQQNNLFENANPYSKYRFEFDVLKPEIVKDIEIDFNFSYYYEFWVEFTPSTMKLEKLNDDGTVAGILQTYDIDDTSYMKQSTNRYTLKLGDDAGGNSIIWANGPGRYAIEFTGNLYVKSDPRRNTVLMRNNAQIIVYTRNKTYPDTVEPIRPSRKFYIDTKVTKANVEYQ